MLPLLVAAVASAGASFVAAVAESSAACTVNSGMQYFRLEGGLTAAVNVIDDGLLDTGITDIFDESV